MRCILLPMQAELKVAIRVLKTQYKADLVKELKVRTFAKLFSFAEDIHISFFFLSLFF